MTPNFLPSLHPLRTALHNEIHARPAELMEAPLAITHIVMLTDAAERQASREHVCQLLREHHLPQPGEASTHVLTDVGPFHLRWELHTEFVAWTFSAPIDAQPRSDTRLPPTALEAVPCEWLARLPGQSLSNLHLWVLPDKQVEPAALLQRMLQEATLVGSAVSGGAGKVYTDFAIHGDGYSRMLLLASSQLTPRRLGRLVQRLLEIETYRMAALLGLPAARQAAQVLASAETELAELARAIREADPDSETVLLDRLTRLASQVESEYAGTHSRFSASSAYFELVYRRIQDIREMQLNGLQTIGEFMERRLSPARATCEWAARRQNALSERVSRISNLLRTRVEIDQQHSSQQLLSTMNRRQGQQLQLQSTVEGLSVAAITYYITGLISYLTKGAQHLGWPLSPESTAALAIPLVALAVWWSLRRMHQRLFHGRDSSAREMH